MRRAKCGFFILFVMVCSVVFLCGCTKAPVSETMILDDITEYLQNSWSVTEINSMEIVKRRTDKSAHLDTVYIKVDYDSENANYVSGYKMEYGLYNEGWILDNVEECYEDVEWEVHPLRGISQEALLSNYLPTDAVIESNEIDLAYGAQFVEYTYLESHRYCDITVRAYIEFYFSYDHWYLAGDETVESKTEDWSKLYGTWVKPAENSSISAQIVVTEFTGSYVSGTIDFTVSDSFVGGGSYTLSGTLEDNFWGGHPAHSIVGNGSTIDTQYWVNGYGDFGTYALIVDMDGGIYMSSAGYSGLSEKPFEQVNDVYAPNVPDQVVWTDIVDISADLFLAAGLRSDGTVVIGGLNFSGEGDIGWTDIVAISASTSHIVGLRSDGTVVAAGDNEYGQCEVSGWADIVAVSSYNYTTVGLRSDGTVVAAGGSEKWRSEVSRWTDITALSTSSDHTVGVQSDGKVVIAFDYSGYSEVPEDFDISGDYDVSEWTDIVSIANGAQIIAGLRSDGTAIVTGPGL